MLFYMTAIILNAATIVHWHSRVNSGNLSANTGVYVTALHAFIVKVITLFVEQHVCLYVCMYVYVCECLLPYL